MVSVLWFEGQAFGIGVTLTVLRFRALWVGMGFLNIAAADASLAEPALENILCVRYSGQMSVFGIL